MGGMLLAVTEERASLQHRAVMWGGPRLASVQDDLQRPFRLEEEVWVPDASPLQALLGASGDTARSLTLVASGGEPPNGVGIDWLLPLVGKPPLRVGHELHGSEIVEVVEKGLVEIGEQLELLRAAATDPFADHVQRRITSLLETVRVVPDPTSFRGMTDAYASDDLVGLAAAELLLWGRLDRPLRTCEHCGCPFVPHKRIDEIYCRRVAPGEPLGGSTCREVGPQQRYADTQTPLQKAYRRAYKRLDLRQRRGAFSRQELDDWRVQARKLLAEAKEANWDEQRLSDALRSVEPGAGGDQS